MSDWFYFAFLYGEVSVSTLEIITNTTSATTSTTTTTRSSHVVTKVRCLCSITSSSHTVQRTIWSFKEGCSNNYIGDRHTQLLYSALIQFVYLQLFSSSTAHQRPLHSVTRILPATWSSIVGCKTSEICTCMHNGWLWIINIYIII